MSLTQDGTTLREQINQANPNKLMDYLRRLNFGNILRAMITSIFGKAPVTSAYQLGTLQAIVLSDFAKASSIVRAYSRAAGAGTGELTVVAYGTTPTSGQIAVGPNGDIVLLGADAHTLVDVQYIPRKHDTIEVELPVPAGGTLAIPTGLIPNGALDLLEAEVTVGSGAGKKIILVPAATCAASKACLNVAKTSVIFGDVGASVNSKARIKFSVPAAVDLDVQLEAAAPY